MKLSEFKSQTEFIDSARQEVDLFLKINNCIERLEQGVDNGQTRLNIDLTSFGHGLTKLEITNIHLCELLKVCRNCYKKRLEKKGIDTP